MRKLIIALGALGMILTGAASAQAGDRHHGHGYHSAPNWVGAILFGSHHERGHRAYDRRYDKRYGYHHSHRGYGHRHGYYDHDYKKHKHKKYKHKKYKHAHKHRILPIRKIVKKLHRRDYHHISRIVLKRDRYRVRAYDYKGRPVKLVVNAHNGRILRKRYR